MNYRTGVGYLRVNPTCKADYSDCNPPNKIEGVPRVGFQSYLPLRRRNQVSINASVPSVTIEVALTNSIHPAGPAIDSKTKLKWDGGEDLDPTVKQDPFPSFELYQAPLRRNVVKIICLNLEQGSGGGLINFPSSQRTGCDRDYGEYQGF